MLGADPSMVKFPAMVAENNTLSQSYGDAYGKVAASIWQIGTFEAMLEMMVIMSAKQYTHGTEVIWSAHSPMVTLKNACGTLVSSKDPIRMN